MRAASDPRQSDLRTVNGHVGRMNLRRRGPPMPLTAAETAAARRLIELALAEDLGAAGDVTSLATIPADLAGRALVIARAAGEIAGLPVAALVCETVDPGL